jgi:hypothetical protein
VSRACNQRRRSVKVRAEDSGIPLFIDIHHLAGVTLEQLADAHLKDLAVEGDFGVSYHKYWLNEERGRGGTRNDKSR